MARLIQRIIEEPRPCSYLTDRRASLEHHIMADATSDELEVLLARGWRRFGPDYFRPVCAPCSECVPIRIPVARFAPSRSQRRVTRKITSLRVVISAPGMDQQKLDLYHKWHAFRERERDWEPAELTMESYFWSFSFPHPSARELCYYDVSGKGPPRLVGVGICDETRASWSAVYFYYDPEYAALSPGVGNVLFQVELARSRGRAHVYLGYYVEGSRSMGYKARFHPSERLIGWPGPDEEPRWVDL